MAFYAGRIDPRAGDGEPDDRRAHRPQRPRRPALRHLRALPRAAAPGAGAGRRTAPTCASCSRSPPAAWSSPPSRSSFPTRRATATRCSPTGATSSSSPTRPTAASTTSSTASPATCATRLPERSFIGFTGTPIELTDGNTRAVFGDYISVYDIQRAVEDGATVPIYYESRLAKLDAEARPSGRRSTRSSRRSPRAKRSSARRSSRRKWAQLEAVVGAEKRLELVAARHRRRTSRTAWRRMDGKAMIVVHEPADLRRAVPQIVALRPEWHGDDDAAGRAQGRDDRLGVRPARLAAAHPQQAAARGAGRSASATPTTRSGS